MSISEITVYRNSYCPRCNTPLLPQATFCGSCGEPLDKRKDVSSLLQDEQDIQARYRLTALLRRSPHVNLYFALDNQQSRLGQQRMIVIRDIDITSLHDETRLQAIELVQQEYDSLNHWHLPHVMPVIDLRYFQGHLYMVAGYPSATSHAPVKVENTPELAPDIHRLYTLLDFLQGGQELPSEQQMLLWISYLCQALEGLHQHQIVIGELDPSTIILNENSGMAEPALMISWLPSQLRELLPSAHTSISPTLYFSAPEAIQGQAEPRSDIYSLGAILYLLLVGSPPGEAALRTRGRLRIPRDLSWRVGPHVIDCMMMALSIEPSERFQSAGAMAEALYNPLFRRPQTVKLNTGMLPAITFERLKESQGRQAPTSTQPIVEATNATSDTSDTSDTDTTPKKEAAPSWFKQLQRTILGQQQRKIMAAAIIESPLRVQPDQSFALRLHIVGRDEPTPAPGARQGDHPAGLSGLVHGNTALIEIRSVLYQSFAYLVQQTTITIPAEGYVAEVTIPMQPLSDTPGGRRERLHIFFLDEHHRPLYEKPFVVEIFVSPLVKHGQEGHNVLSIPT